MANMKGRPKLPDCELKHPRKKVHRPSVLHGDIRDVPDPSKAAIKRWKGIVEACIHAVITQPSRADNTAPKNKVTIKFKSGWKKPTDFLVGRLKYSCDEYEIREFNAEQLLLWLYVRKLSKYCARDIYKKRQSMMGEITKMENMLDMVDVGEYDGGIEINQGEDE